MYKNIGKNSRMIHRCDFSRLRAHVNDRWSMDSLRILWLMAQNSSPNDGRFINPGMPGPEGGSNPPGSVRYRSIGLCRRSVPKARHNPSGR